MIYPAKVALTGDKVIPFLLMYLNRSRMLLFR